MVVHYLHVKFSFWRFLYKKKKRRKKKTNKTTKKQYLENQAKIYTNPTQSPTRGRRLAHTENLRLKRNTRLR